MPAPKVSEARLRQAVEAVNQKLREGFRPPSWGGPYKSAMGAAADELIAKGAITQRQMMQHLLASAKERLGIEPDESLYRPKVYQHRSPGEPNVPTQDHTVEDAPEGEPLRMAVIGDAHDSPHLADKSRFYWMGRFIAERKIPHVVSIGDWMTLDSMSTHTDPATFEGLGKPTFQQDIDSFHASQRAFREGLGDWKPKLDVVLGNHEYRAWRWANAHREIVGGGVDPSLALLEAFAQWGWRTTPFGEYRFIAGVGFIHAPLVPGTAGKTYGGKTGGQRAANDAMFDIIRGDDHKLYINTSPKIGPVKSPRVFGTATALPPGYIETYARKNPGDWEAGICEATIWGGRVRHFAFHDMHLLRLAYAKAA